MYNGRGLSQLCTCTEGFECLRHGLEKRRGLFLSFSLSNTPHYKNVPFEVPDNWEWCRLDDLAFYKKGPFGSSLIKAMFVQKGDDTYKVYEQKNAIQKDHELGSYYISKEKYCSLSSFAVHPYDIIVSCAGTIGETYVLPQNIQEGIINQALMLIRLYNREIERFYLLYFDFILKQEAYKESKGTAIKNIPPFDVLKNFLIPIPPKEEQNRILSEVDKWMSFVNAIETNSNDLQTIIKQTKSKILDLAIHGKLVQQGPNDEPAIELLKRINPDFTPCDNGHYTFKIPNSWTWCKLGDIAQSNIGLTYKPTDITDNGIPVYRSNNIRDRKIDKSDLVRVNAPILEKQFLNIGDLLICARNGSRRLVGKCAIIEELDEVTSFGAFMAVCRSEYNQWIFNLLNTTYFDRYLDDSNSTAINQVTQRMLLALHIPLPPLSEQQRIVQKIEELFSVLDNIQNALEV